MNRKFKKKIGRMLYIDFIGIVAVDPDSPDGRILQYTRDNCKDIDPYFDMVGKRRKYETPEEMEQVIQQYFESCQGEIYDKFGKVIRDSSGKPVIRVRHPYTITGLARALGLTRYSLLRYRDLAIMGELPLEFAYILSDARARVEEYAEARLYDKDGSAGAQFMLVRAFDWRSHMEDQKMKIEKRKYKIQKKEAAAKLKLLGQGTDPDNELHITIKRAEKPEG